jgi:hypothetical protein
MSAVMRRMPATAAVGVLVSVMAAGCGGSSSASDAPTAAAKQFVGAVTRDDRTAWCDQVGEALLVPHRTGGLVRQLLVQCKSSDLFAITASCDREAVISGTSVAGDSVHGDGADVRLSSGATLALQRSRGTWYVTSISGGSAQKIKEGLCAGAGS